jgi:hypothetical protein
LRSKGDLIKEAMGKKNMSKKRYLTEAELDKAISAQK